MKYLILIKLFICSMISGQYVPQLLTDGFRFTEGPALSPNGLIYFSDVLEYKIYIFNPETKKTVLWMEKTGGANGLYFDANGNLVACAGKARQLIRIDAEKNTEILADSFQGKKLNSPNDLWIDHNGGIYFTDPRYGKKDNLEQDGMHVYYLNQSGNLMRVTHDLIRPNGIIGSPDAKKIYIVDEGDKRTWVYDILKDGSLDHKELFCNEGIDGLTITSKGNICITTKNGISIYSPSKDLLKTINFESTPTNVVYFNEMLFVTSQAGQLWQVRLSEE